MSYIPEAIRRLVYERASGRCEYCLYPEARALKRHEVDHIIAEKHGGATVESNLCLCCAICNRFKGSDLSAVDPETEEVFTLFHPRRDQWGEHFQLRDAEIVGLTPKGRVTIRLLRMNDADRIEDRASLIKLKQYP